MPNYSTNLKTWGSTGSIYPDSYNYVEGEQPVDAWDNFFNSNVISDIEHLINVTNNELLARDGTVNLQADLSDDNANLIWDYSNGYVPASSIEQGSGSGLDADTVDGKDASGLGVDAEEDGTVIVSSATGMDFTGFISVTDDGDGTVTIDPSHNHDSLYDDYSSWTLKEGNGTETENVTSGQTLTIYGGTDILTEIDSNGNLEVRHTDTSTQGNVSTGGADATVIEGLNLDGRGHVTNISTTDRTISHWASPQSDVGWSDYRITNLKALTFANSEHADLQDSGLGWDNSEGGSAFAGGLIFQDTNGKNGHLVTADTDMSIPGYLDNRSGDRIGVPTYTSTSDLPSGNPGDIAYVSNDNSLYVYN